MFTAFSRPVLMILFVLTFFTSFSQQPAPKTLLWRISGKGLQQPSYLYGTMHLQDKRLFQFGDSVYHAIETTAGLATEIDFQQFVDSLFADKAEEEKADKLLSTQKVKLDRSKLNSTADSLLRKFGVQGNVVSRKMLKDIRSYRMRKLLQDGEMPTIVDGFLLALAQRQDKWTGGIEDLDDQLNTLDELGAELKPEQVLYSEKEFQQTLENMFRIYTSQDLDRIDDWSNSEYGRKQRDALLTQRNVKMAWRMDSLSAVRPTFFAVGAAHLPGDSGVIRLLRNRGFTVEPVFSARTISGDEYASHLKQKEWKEVRAEGEVYSIKMPGNPVDQNKLGEGVKMKFYFDLTSMTFYMAGHTNGYDPKARPLEKTIQEMAKNINGKKAGVTPKTVAAPGLQGLEAVFEKEGMTFRMQLFAKGKTLFMLMAGSLKKTTTAGDDATRFFNSFVPGESIARKDWKEFSLPEKAFAVQMPSTPSRYNEIDNEVAKSPNWTYTTYQVVDKQTEYFYMMQVRQVKPTYNIDKDSVFLQALKEDYKTRLDSITRFDITTYKDYPAAFMDYEMKKVSGVLKALHVIRGNQVYVLIAGAPKGSDLSDIDFFLESFKLLPDETTNWQSSETAGFSSAAPAPFKKIKLDSAASVKYLFEHYCSYNERNAVSYEVFKNGFSPNYWTLNDTAFYEAKLGFYKSDKDSLLHREWVQNGTIRGVDYTIQPYGSSRLKRLRFLVNKDTLYTLHTEVPAVEWNRGEHEKFFNEFRVQNEVPPTLFTSKASQLLQALRSTDSIEFAQSIEDLDNAGFRKEELSLLHKSFLENYRDSDEYNSTHNKLIDHLLPFADNTTLDFIEKEYPQLVGNKEAIRYKMLLLLTEMKTSESFSLLKKLLLNPLPQQGNPIPLQSRLLDSLELTATLFPQLMQKADDSLLAPVIAAVTNQLLDSGLLTRETILPYQEQILKAVNNETLLLKKGVYEPWELIRWADLLGWLNVPDGTKLLQNFLVQKDVYLKKAAILALLKNNHVVPAVEIAKVAADKSARQYFYEALQQMQKESLFPPLYASQKALAESDVYNLFASDYDDFTLTYVGQRIVPYQGKKALFHLFKVRLAYDDDEKKKDFMSVAGPYTPGSKEKILYADATGFYTDETFLPQKTDKLLRAYLLSLEPAEK